MAMRFSLRWAAFVLSAAAFLPVTAHAHRAWLFPSATVLSGKDVWVTIDAAISNDLFFFEHNPMRLNGLSVVAPDGTKVEPQNIGTGRYRSTFDLRLTQPGTYRLAVVNDGLFAQYMLNGEKKRWRGTTARTSEIPAEATDVVFTESQSRVEVFVTSGKPTEKALELTRSGLELAPVTHPNNLFTGESASFRLMLDGAPAPGVEVSVIPGGIRYRDKLNEMKLTTDADGKITVKWPEPGMYWLNASIRDDKASVKGATRRAGYSATLEVLPD
jgi:uncharacterized GH25 family protein